MFGTIASRYDLVNHIISFNTDRMWRRKAAAMTAAGHPLKILDVACGTADLTIEMHRQMPRAEITGIDISEEMLQLGRSKIENLQENKEHRRHKPDVPKEIDYKSIDKPLSANSNQKFSKITLKQGNAEKIESPGETFDAVCIASE
jgi:ubiquinone/menaquinone biosynthesis C-methylase UbiE